MTQLGDDPVHAIPATRALKRSRGRWRLFAFLLIALAVILAYARFTAVWTPRADTLARVEIGGTITTDHERTRRLAELAEDDAVQAVIVAINSPGGTTAGGEELYESLRRLAEVKPVVAVIDELGASAAYMTAIGTDRIFTRRLSIVGSIGVFYGHVDAGGLLENIGIDYDKVASGPLKAEPDIDEPITPEIRESLAALVDNSYQWFVDIVAERREMPRARVLALADGRIMTGAMAVDAGLMDAIGGEAEAIAWLETERGIDADLPVVKAFPPPERTNWLVEWLVSSANSALGVDLDRVMALDGLAALWHPSSR
ncbi:signal peptide peptidase SppA [Pelagibacterium xiamenense]|uniref:signal peptide peptidase SppA n=1 Tax=Pelagibacterium xiamenense TaxID=2901140 RepID=UPI001E485899|nr:signal peptide peptidase SppA [Pelagibacterium xiamenense]MCD7058572.1 signal peptide peptidase SppA [Pelagibacterium xiamenense]